MGGHPLYEYRSLVKYLTNANAQNLKGKSNQDLVLAGIVAGITKKRDNKGNPFAFIEFEDLTGRFELALFNQDYEKHFSKLAAGSIFFIFGSSKSNYSGNDEAAPRVSPTNLIPLEELFQYMRGEIRLNITLPRLSREFVDEFIALTAKARGGFVIRTIITTDEGDSYQLEAQRKIFPSNDLLKWLDEMQFDFSLRFAYDEKSS